MYHHYYLKVFVENIRKYQMSIKKICIFLLFALFIILNCQNKVYISPFSFYQYSTHPRYESKDGSTIQIYELSDNQKEIIKFKVKNNGINKYHLIYIEDDHYYMYDAGIGVEVEYFFNKNNLEIITRIMDGMIYNYEKEDHLNDDFIGTWLRNVTDEKMEIKEINSFENEYLIVIYNTANKDNFISGISLGNIRDNKIVFDDTFNNDCEIIIESRSVLSLKSNTNDYMNIFYYSDPK